MSQQLLSVSRAVRLVGVSRATLQKQIREHGIETFEGRIALNDLLRLYPQTQAEDNGILERVRQIRERAKPGVKEDRDQMHIPDVVVHRINALGRELADTKQLLRRYTDCVGEMVERLQTLSSGPDGTLRDGVEALRGWFDEQLLRPEQWEPEQTRLLARDSFLRVISTHIRVVPSGHDFWVEGSESLLEAALRSGLHVDYGCTGGVCGSCKARVVNGEVHKLRDHEYEIGESEQRLGYVLMCCNTAVTDMTIEAGEAHGVEDLTTQTIPARLDRIETPTDGMRVLHVRTPSDQSLRFLAGQSVTLTLDGASGEYYVASCPCDGSYLHFHIRAADTPFSRQIFAAAEPGLPIRIAGPHGGFVLREDTTDPILLLAWEDGFAPLKSMMEHAVAMDVIEDFQLEWFSSPAGCCYMENLCRAWNDALDNFSYHLTTCDPVDLASALSTRIGAIPELSRRWVYCSGPGFFVEAVRAALAAAEVDADRVLVEVLNP